MRLSRLGYRRIGPLCAHSRQKQIPADARVRSYPAIEKDQMVWVWMGDSAKGDATKIADYPYATTTPADGPTSMTFIPSRPTTC